MKSGTRFPSSIYRKRPASKETGGPENNWILFYVHKE